MPRSQARPLIFDLQIRVPDVLYEEVVEVDEEVLLPLGTEPDRCTSSATCAHLRSCSNQPAAHASTAAGSLHSQCTRSTPAAASVRPRAGGSMMHAVCRRSGQHPKQDEQAYAPEGERKETVTGEMVCVRRRVDLDALRADLQASRACVCADGVQSSPCRMRLPAQNMPCNS